MKDLPAHFAAIAVPSNTRMRSYTELTIQYVQDPAPQIVAPTGARGAPSVKIEPYGF